MRTLAERGFTLIEMLIAIVVLGVILGAIYQSIGSTQRMTQSQVQRLHVQQDTRAAALFLSHALRELDATDGDVIAATSNSLRIRGMRWTGVLCTDPAPSVGGVAFVVHGAMEFGVRPPDPLQDSVLLFADGDPTTRGDDTWLYGGLRASSAGICSDGTSGTLLGVRITAASGGTAAALAGVTEGAPVRGFQIEDISPYLDSYGIYWLGSRTADKGGTWSTEQRLVGPLTADGLAFAYFDATGAPAATVADCETVALVVRGRSPAPARLSTGGMGYIRDSVITRVTLRNNARF